ncbi:SDR family oxidoreductase [Pseudooceanicola sp.]|uniref:SDR family oxidoreductase n=1 Tax=Pseudooceanicola sp. TaxID=1914328 RepID=UPI002614209B|nr:SDR family oxidoreductase [Pseudooceanicola sp.]MDF1856024.1 SDR family oxidoreductase [Pseudooceanicola sp.]
MARPGQHAPAWISGGSSGIGLEVARQLAAKGRPVVLIARNAERLAVAAGSLRRDVPGAGVDCIACDVTDHAAVMAAVAEAFAARGAPGIVVASAGLAEPGRFLDQEIGSHHAQLSVNYTGTLNLLHAAAPLMRDAGGGQMALISSGAAFFGIYGYGAYAPSKFAVRALAEVLRVELAPHDISVTLCYPPDTDTPQLAAESLTKPEATKIISEGGGLWQPGDVARLTIRGMERGRFAVTPGWQMTALYWIAPLIWPIMRWHQGRVVRKVGAEK